jgi:hypothetical protein
MALFNVVASLISNARRFIGAGFIDFNAREKMSYGGFSRKTRVSASTKGALQIDQTHADFNFHCKPRCPNLNPILIVITNSYSKNRIRSRINATFDAGPPNRGRRNI